MDTANHDGKDVERFPSSVGYDRLSPVQREAVDMICLKLSRIISGQSHFRDHWDDIAGYARLATEPW